jgi:hypothetical protein
MDLVSIKSELIYDRSNSESISTHAYGICNIVYISVHNFTNVHPDIRFKLHIMDDLFYLSINNIYIMSLYDNLMYLYDNSMDLSMSGICKEVGKISKYLIYIGNAGIRILDLPKYLIYLTGYWYTHYKGNTKNVMYSVRATHHPLRPQYLILNGILKRFNIYCKNCNICNT